MICPFWSRTVAVSRTVFPSAANSAVAGLTCTVVARGTSGADDSAGPPSPQPAHSPDTTTRTMTGTEPPRGNPVSFGSWPVKPRRDDQIRKERPERPGRSRAGQVLSWFIALSKVSQVR